MDYGIFDNTFIVYTTYVDGKSMMNFQLFQKFLENQMKYSVPLGTNRKQFLT